MTYWRCRVVGTLKLESPLALADGGFEDRASNESGEKRQIATVLKTKDGRAVIPGSSLKGVLRAHLATRGIDEPAGARDPESADQTDSATRLALNVLFGEAAQPKANGQKTQNLGQGGKVEFGYCYSKTPVVFVEQQSVAINRVTRAAAERQLFSREVVPAGTEFDVELLGFGLSPLELSALLAAFDGVRLGSKTGSEFGRFHWHLGPIQSLARADVVTSLTKHGAGDIWQAAQPVTVESLPAVALTPRPSFTLKLRLDFTSWFLVRDPARNKPHASTTDDPETRAPDGFPLLTNDQRVLLPATGFRGAFRSHVERIGRTLHPHAGGDPNREPTDAEVRANKDRLVRLLFGDTKSRAVLCCSPFIDRKTVWHGWQNPSELPEEVREQCQTALVRREFVAIDRFTGGAAEGLKFDCVAAWRPTLAGTVSFDGDVLAKRATTFEVSPAAAFGLLLLGLRDLCDGDIAFGFGWGKGFGECRGEIERFDFPDPERLAHDWGLSSGWPNAMADEQARSASGPFASLSAEQRALAALSVRAARQYFQQGRQVAK